MSVSVPVMWVVRISARESLETTAFCRPKTKHSSMTVAGTNSPSKRCRLVPATPKPISSTASSSSGSAYSPEWRRRRA